MAKLLNAFTTGEGGEAGTWRKKRDAQDRIYYVKDGEGIIGYGTDSKAAKRFAGAKRQLNRLVTDSEGQLPEGVREADSMAELEEMTGIPFDSQEGFLPIRGEVGDSLEEKQRAEGNRFWGFYDARRDRYDGPNDPEAAKDYIQFRNELKEAQGEQEAAIIRKQYGLRGS